MKYRLIAKWEQKIDDVTIYNNDSFILKSKVKLTDAELTIKSAEWINNSKENNPDYWINADKLVIIFQPYKK